MALKDFPNCPISSPLAKGTTLLKFPPIMSSDTTARNLIRLVASLPTANEIPTIRQVTMPDITNMYGVNECTGSRKVDSGTVLIIRHPLSMTFITE